MSKGKNAVKNTKKLPNPAGKKEPSDYQAGKKSSSSSDSAPAKKK